ncbi:phosphate ABC transporter substrate-binding protein PstS [Micromonospora sp. NPDC047548]|uniref:phosphate ABC transporter substrate-binding protein PstS n=1 Tax=Micromonospora sp. NPDC047548 TaxID=3155624 RepID=UPI003402F8CC
MLRLRIRRRPAATRGAARLAAAVAAVALVLTAAPPAQAAPRKVPISGIGSTWSANAISTWARNVQANNIQVEYEAAGSTQGRVQFREGKAHFGVSEIPYGLQDIFSGTDSKGARQSAYMPIVAGGTAFMYNLKIGGRRVTNLRLSGEVIAKIFTGVIRKWNDPAIRADNPGLNLPARSIVPVVRQDGSGTTAQFTLWMSKQHQDIWAAHCRKWNKPSPCGITSVYPAKAGSGFVGATGSDGVSTYVRQENAEGAITYVEYSYAINAKFPVVKVLNEGGYYVEPTANNVAVALTQAKINSNRGSDDYLTQILDGVYRNNDPRSYPLSSYSYMIVPTKIEYNLTADSGYTLGEFAYYFLCEGQRQAEVLGYSPLPINLVQAGMEQAQQIPGVAKIDVAKKIRTCNNPTVSADGGNALAKSAKMPSACDRKGSTQSGTGTAGAPQDTPILPAARCSGGGGNTGGTGTGTGTGGTGTGGTAGPGTGAGPQLGTPGGAAGPTPGVAVVDPDTGEVAGAGGDAGAGGGEQVAALPVSLDGTGGWQLRHTLMLLAALLLVGLVIGPPLVSHAVRSRQADSWGER